MLNLYQTINSLSVYDALFYSHAEKVWALVDGQ